MTHTLHRTGDRESLSGDYVWQVYPSKGINDDNLPEKYGKVIDLVVSLGSRNWGDIGTGSARSTPVELIRDNLRKTSRLRGVFLSAEQVSEFIREMKRLDLGLSVIISGLTDRIFETCEDEDITPHSVNLSLGVWGKTELLPAEDVLEVTTMCGHHQISADLVDEMKAAVDEGRLTAEEAAEKMTTLCPCGVFNTERAMEILRRK